MSKKAEHVLTEDDDDVSNCLLYPLIPLIPFLKRTKQQYPLFLIRTHTYLIHGKTKDSEMNVRNRVAEKENLNRGRK